MFKIDSYEARPSVPKGLKYTDFQKGERQEYELDPELLRKQQDHYLKQMLAYAPQRAYNTNRDEYRRAA